MLVVGIAVWWGVLFLALLGSPDVGQDLRRATDKLGLLTSIPLFNRALSLLFVAFFLPLYLYSYPFVLAVIALLCGVIAHWSDLD